MGTATSSAAAVLYIEDDFSNLQVIESIVWRLRPRRRFVPSNDEINGLQLVPQLCPEVVFDLQPPGMAGETVLAAWRADPGTRGLSVLLLSADATILSRQRFSALGTNGYLTKPLNVVEVLEKTDILQPSLPMKINHCTG